MTGKPLHGLRVVEVGSTLSAPYCGLLLAQLGAEVLKVEPPHGDITRQIGAARSPGMASLFLALNTDKQSIVLDLRSHRGREQLHSLIGDSDVVLHNMRPDAAQRAGLAAEEVRSRHPSVVLCAIQGYATGSGAENRPVYDDIAQAESGMVSVQAALSGRPSYVATVLADKASGMMAALAILAALRRRDRTRRGAVIEIPMVDVTTGFALLEHLAGETFDPAVGPPVYRRVTSPHRGPYRTADGWLSVTIYTAAQWERFLTHIGRADLLRDPRFASVTGRSANIDQLYRLLEELMPTTTTSNWLDLFAQLDIPAAEVRDVASVISERGARAITHTLAHPTEGKLRFLPLGVRIDGKQLRPDRPPPLLGEHTEQALRRRAGRTTTPETSARSTLG
ncbi:CoA transferase [Thermocrispum sp.]|uniref:CaiB/BaiF CoA transferase family protein n=1 Tax=Thermocrispum sp. TaxID=2060768 RepID=UPI00257C72CA|nr:CoA transferase [Thermocrispum sp.]